MESVILKFLTLTGLAIAFACVAMKAASSSVGARIKAERMLIESAADLAGLKLRDRVAGVLALAGPAARIALAVIRKKRLVAIDRQLPDAMMLLCNSLKAGISLPQALEMASAELPKPIGEELTRVVAQQKLGRTVEDALALFAERVPTEDASLVVQSVSVLRRSGGNLVETFATLAHTIEGRLAVEERIRVLTAQGVIQGAVLLAMPWLLCAALWVVAPDYVLPLFSTRLGLIFTALAFLLEVLGALWLKKIVTIKV